MICDLLSWGALHRQRRGLDDPLRADKLLFFGVEAEHGEEHLRRLDARYGRVGVKSAAAHTGNKAQGSGIVDIPFRPVAADVAEEV